MNLYEAEYQSKRVTIEEALDSLKDGDVIGTSQCANEPTAFFDAIDHLRSSGKHFRMFAPMCFSPHRFLSDPIYQNTFDMDITFLMGATRKGREQGLLSYYPGDLHNGASRWIEVNGCNVFIAAATPMDRHGYFMIPLCLIHEKTFLEAADRVILQVNPNLPRIYGDTEVHIRNVDMIVEAETPLPYLPVSTPNELEMTIGNYVASLVNDGDCIQLGIGSMPNAVGHHLMDKKDLGLHTEMFTSIMGDMIRKGVITGARKNYNKGLHIGCFAGGDLALYETLSTNPAVRLCPTSVAVDPGEICKNDNMVSINTIIEMDITGQVCSESIGPKQFSGTGGAFCFAYGALHSKGGKGILAFQASTKKGVSKISSQLKPGAVVSIPRNYVDYVVTEYGIAHLRGRSVKERVLQLISIAHPDVREELRRYAKEQFMIV